MLSTCHKVLVEILVHFHAGLCISVAQLCILHVLDSLHKKMGSEPRATNSLVHCVAQAGEGLLSWPTSVNKPEPAEPHLIVSHLSNPFLKVLSIEVHHF